MAKKKKAKAAPKTGSWRARWPKIRAAVIAYLVLFNIVAAIPSPGVITKETLKRPINRSELDRWVGLMGAIGIDTDAEELGDWYIGVAADLEHAHAWAIKPIEPLMSFTQTWQGWRLFGMPDEHPYALEIEVDRDGQREVLYQSGVADKRWNASLLEYRRVRAVYNPGHAGPPSTYRGFGQRISDQIFDEMPDVDRVLITLLQTHTTLPGEPVDLEVKRTYPLTFARSK